MTLISLEKEGRTAIVTINNPPLNVLSRQVTNEISEIFDQLEEDENDYCYSSNWCRRTGFYGGSGYKRFPTMDWEKGASRRIHENG